MSAASARMRHLECEHLNYLEFPIALNS